MKWLEGHHHLVCEHFGSCMKKLQPGNDTTQQLCATTFMFNEHGTFSSLIFSMCSTLQKCFCASLGIVIMDLLSWLQRYAMHRLHNPTPSIRTLSLRINDVNAFGRTHCFFKLFMNTQFCFSFINYIWACVAINNRLFSVNRNLTEGQCYEF